FERGEGNRYSGRGQANRLNEIYRFFLVLGGSNAEQTEFGLLPPKFLDICLLQKAVMVASTGGQLVPPIWGQALSSWQKFWGSFTGKL
ncbi:MAG: hypothetical protein VCE91_09460, partial [Nitrospinota bacterium]